MAMLGLTSGSASVISQGEPPFLCGLRGDTGRLADHHPRHSVGSGRGNRIGQLGLHVGNLLAEVVDRQHGQRHA